MVALTAGCGDGDDDSPADRAFTSPRGDSPSPPDGGRDAGDEGRRDAGDGGDPSGARAGTAPSGGDVLDELGDDQVRPPPGTPEARATDTVAKIYDALENLRDVDLAAICALMSRQARRHTRRYVTATANYGPGWTCEEALHLLVERSKLAKGFRRVRNAEVVGINVEGDRATASVQFGEDGGVAPVPLVREDGEWKLGSAPTGGSPE